MLTLEKKTLVRAGLITSCREWIGDSRCNAPAEFLLWGKLLPPEALGPRCYDHAAVHVGHAALGDPTHAIADLRPILRALEAEDVAG